MENKWKLGIETFNAIKLPVIILIVLILYHKEIRERLGTSDFEIGPGGISIKHIEAQFKDYKENSLAQVETIESKLNEMERVGETDPQKAQEIINEVHQLKSDIQIQSKQVDQAIAAPEKISIEKVNQAAQSEKEAFEYLVNEDAKNAMEKFQEVEKLYPGYHNAHEISNLLQGKSIISPKDYHIILNKYSWGMNKTIIKELEKKTKK